MIARAATCDQIAPLPSVLSNETAAPSAKTTATANPWARGRRLASHAATYPGKHRELFHKIKSGRRTG